MSHRRPRSLFLLALLAVAATACDAGSEAAFIRGHSFDPCIQVLPACPGVFASCVLDETRYTRRDFPGEFAFLVRASPDAKIEVQIFLSEQRDSGLETLIYWNEPGCSEVYTFDSEGRNLFEEAEETQIIAEKQQIYEGGEHLIEILTDMQAKTVITVDVQEPES